MDVLVTTAGIVDNVEAENYDFPRWRKMLDVNLDGTRLLARDARIHMLAQQIRGSIVLIAPRQPRFASDRRNRLRTILQKEQCQF